ncbi:uncharacterized protein LOC135940777 [Cloeon dipterum]|uniref:uncharacterized protein LOC135940777 n=1 Tax=Cloeon dipterum TaxID=197152 RepID=UPI00321F918F
MSLLYRFARLPDRANTHVFTFIVTRSVTRDLERDVTSREFNCGYQRWAITFSRNDKVLGVYLVWRSGLAGAGGKGAPNKASHNTGMRVYVDFTFTLLNRDHFSVNEAFSGKQVKFTCDCPAQGNRNYIPVSDLRTRNFTDENGEFQLELTMGNVRTVFDSDLRITPQNTSTSKQQRRQQLRLETQYFSFGGFDWNVSLEREEEDGACVVQLNRLTGFDHRCHVRYLVVLGEGERRVDSGLIDDISDTEGRVRGWCPGVTVSEVMRKGVVRLHLEMLLANSLSEVNVSTPPISVGTAQVVAQTAPAQCFDKDKQQWLVTSDLHGDTLRFHIVFKDIHNVPRNHLRYVSWSSYIMRFPPDDSSPPEPVALEGSPFSHYYAQDTSDEGIMMETEVPVKEMRVPDCEYFSDRSQVRLQLEWEDSYLLFQSTYHKYDDVTRVHNYQMRREINALQAENYSLERQLFSYQKSIAYAHSRGQYSAENTPVGGTPDAAPYRHHGSFRHSSAGAAPKHGGHHYHPNHHPAASRHRASTGGLEVEPTGQSSQLVAKSPNTSPRHHRRSKSPHLRPGHYGGDHPSGDEGEGAGPELEVGYCEEDGYYEEEQDDEERRSYSLGERSLSTDTEYA